MAIIIWHKNEKVYVSATGVITDKEKLISDRLDKELKNKISALENSLTRRNLVTPAGVKTNALRVWYEFGLLLYEIGKKYGIFGTTDEIYYWRTIYGYVSPLIQKKDPPKKSKDILRNHFRLCSFLARKKWDVVEEIGNWSVWRDILDNKEILSDVRVFDWIIETLRRSKLGHKQLRPFLHETRRRLTKLDTSVLNDKELRSKLIGLTDLLPNLSKKA